MRPLVGENSVQLADAVRTWRLEAVLVALPIDSDGLEVSAAVAQFEVVYAGREAPDASAMTIEGLAAAALVLPEARWGDDDPTRRQLGARSGPGSSSAGAFAFIRRRNARLSPATGALMALAERHLAELPSP